MPELGTAYDATLPAHPGGAAPPRDRDNREALERSREDVERRRPEQSSFSKWLLRVGEQIDASDRQKRLSLIRSQIRAHQYLDGNFRGYVDANCQWREAERGEGEIWYQDNQIYPYVRTALMELSRAQTEVVWNAAPGTGEAMKAAAKFAQARYDANRDRTFGERLTQTRNAYALLNGILFVYTYANFTGRSERVPTVSENEDETEIGYEEIGTMENEWIVPNPVGVVVALNATCIQDTPYLMWKQLVLRSVLEAKYPDIDFSRASGDSISSLELRYITDQQGATPGGGLFGASEDGTGRSVGNDSGAELEQVEFRQVWLDYPIYCNKTFAEDVDLGDGETLKAGQKLGTKRRGGLYFAYSGDIVVTNHDEDKNRKWSSSPYGIRPGSMYGSGISTSLPQQDLINDLKSLEMANAWNNGVAREFVNPAKIQEISADPTLPTNMDLSEGETLANAYAVAPPMPLSAEVYALEDQAKGSMQNQIGALSGGSGGLADSQKWGDTATAISIKRDLAVGRFSPDLALMADQIDREQAYQFLRNEQEYFTPQQWQRYQGDFGEEAVKTFLEAEIGRDLIASVVPGSYMPKSEAQVQSQTIAYAQILPAIMQSMDPELIAYAAETFNMPEHLGGWNSDKAYVGRLVKRFEQLAQIFIQSNGDIPDPSLEPVSVPVVDPMTMQPVVDPMTGQPAMQEQPSPGRIVGEQINNHSGMPVDIFLDNHEAIIDALRDWRKTDAGRNASNALLSSVSLRLLFHQEGIAKQRAMMARTEQEAMQPVVDQQKAEQAEMMAAEQAAQQQQAQQQAAQAEQQLQLEAVNKTAELAGQDAEREERRSEAEANRLHQKDLKAMELLEAERLAEMSNQDSPSSKKKGK